MFFARFAATIGLGACFLCAACRKAVLLETPGGRNPRESPLSEQEDSSVLPVPTYMGFALRERVDVVYDLAEARVEVYGRPDDHDETYLAVGSVETLKRSTPSTEEGQLFLLLEGGASCSATLGEEVLAVWAFPEPETGQDWANLGDTELARMVLEQGHAYWARRLAPNDDCVAEYGWGVLAQNAPSFEYAQARPVAASAVSLTALPYLSEWNDSWKAFREDYPNHITSWPSSIHDWDVERSKSWTFGKPNFSDLSAISFDLVPPVSNAGRLAEQPWLEFSGFLSFRKSRPYGPSRAPLRSEEAVSSVVAVGPVGGRFLLATSTRGMWAVHETGGEMRLVPELEATPRRTADERRFGLPKDSSE